MNKVDMTVMPLFASNLIITNVNKQFNNIDISTINFTKSSDVNQTSEMSESNSVMGNYKELGSEILNIFNQYTQDVLKFDYQFTFSESWFTRMKPGDFCHYHQHYNSFYSGLFYFDDYEENSGDICLLNPINQLSMFFMQSEVINIHNAKEWRISPEKNLLILFPSYLQHTILGNASKSPRHSLAFNLVPFEEAPPNNKEDEKDLNRKEYDDFENPCGHLNPPEAFGPCEHLNPPEAFGPGGPLIDPT